MEKNNHNTNNENPLTNEKVGEGEPTEEITKDPVDEIVHYGGEAVPQGHKDEFDPNAPKGSKEDVPGKPGIKNPNTGEVVTPPVDDVTKYGPVDGDPITETKEIPYETKREFDPQHLVQKKSYKKVKMEKNNHNTNNEKSINK